MKQNEQNEKNQLDDLHKYLRAFILTFTENTYASIFKGRSLLRMTVQPYHISEDFVLLLFKARICQLTHIEWVSPTFQTTYLEKYLV